MKKYKISSIYNAPDYESNYYQNLVVYRFEQFGDIFINVDRWSKYSDIHEKFQLIVNDPIWDLIFEDIENCYRAFHAYAVGHDGSHLNYMIINFDGVEDDGIETT